MTAFLVYLLQVTICSALFAGYYWWVLRDGHFYRWNRLYINASVVLSAIIPLLSIPMSTPHIVMPAAADYVAYIVIDPDEAAIISGQTATTPISWVKLGFIFCMLVAFFLFVKELISFVRIVRLKRHSERIHTPETDLYCIEDETAPLPFSGRSSGKKAYPWIPAKAIACCDTNWRTSASATVGTKP